MAPAPGDPTRPSTAAATARREHRFEPAGTNPVAGRPSRRGLLGRRLTTVRDHRAGQHSRRDRRTFLRYSTGAALSVLAAGAGTVLNARPAAASHWTCCSLVIEHTPWCQYYCVVSGAYLSAWGCNNMQCMCYECFIAPGFDEGDCFGAYTAVVGCSDQEGCCGRG